jgi:putative two-component system response regulator
MQASTALDWRSERAEWHLRNQRECSDSPSRAPIIVFVDDSERQLEGLKRLIRLEDPGWDLLFLADSGQALETIHCVQPDVVVTDMAMPQLTGLELIERLANDPNTADICTIMLTGLDEPHLKRRALDVGATDLLNKPVTIEDLQARIRSVLRLKSFACQLKAQNESLEHRVQARTQALRESRREILWRLGRAAEFRDSDTGLHVARVARYSQLIAQAMGMPEDFVETIYLAAPLHDVGKIGVPDEILRKPGALTPQERTLMQEHCQIGAHILGDPRRSTPWDRGTDAGDEHDLADPVLMMALEVAIAHHEHWDGNGYPQRLAGSEIPISARIVALADVYDALTTERVYKKAFSSEEAFRMISESSGRQFDPRVFAAFASVVPEIELARTLLADTSPVPVRLEGEQLSTKAAQG